MFPKNGKRYTKMGAKVIKSTSINNKEWYASQTAWHALILINMNTLSHYI
jgi:hypothetical protein